MVTLKCEENPMLFKATHHNQVFVPKNLTPTALILATITRFLICRIFLPELFIVYTLII